MNWHEIVKYSPQKYDSNGVFITIEQPKLIRNIRV